MLIILIRSPLCVIASCHKTRPWAMCSSAFFSRGLYQFTSSALGRNTRLCRKVNTVICAMQLYPSLGTWSPSVNIAACSDVTFALWILPPEISLNSKLASSGNPDLLQHYNCCFLSHGLCDVKLCCMYTKWSKIP